MTDNTATTQTSLVVGGRTYDLLIAPTYTDPLVVSETQNILGQLSLDDITENLDLAVELLFVAYNGVAAAKDGTVRAEIAELQSALARLCNDCVVTMTTFQSETHNIITELVMVYKWLTRGQEALAIRKLGHCKDSSTAMATSAKALADRFSELQIDSTKTRSKALIEETDEQKRKEAAEQAERTMRAEQAAEQANQAELVAQIGEMQTLYDEAKQREEKESTKALVLGITSAVASAIGAGLGAYAAAKNPLGSLAAASTSTSSGGQTGSQPTQQDTDAKQKQAEEAQNALLKAKDEQTAAQAKVDQLTKAVDELSKTIAAKEQDQSTKPEELKQLKQDREKKQKELEDATRALSTANDKAKSLEKPAADTAAAYAAAGKGLLDVAKSTESLSAAAVSAEASIHEEKMKYLQQKMDLEQQKRKSLVALAGYAESIKNSQAEQGAATLSVNSLHAAVDALGKIIGTLTNASLFWTQMSNYCDRMSRQGLQEDIKDVQDALSLDERLQYYCDPGFMREFLTYLVQWVAVNGLSGDYLIAAGKAQQKAVEYLKKSPTIEEAIKRAPELADNLSILIARDLSKSRQASIDLANQKALIGA